ncbi:MAG: 3-isopropylmalate dehydratase small subunit [Firmicutes bacterium]|nr:3-isopropylmalate dehydratase small subunit [Bacillota bacterium]MDI6705583.1 3-isopropylmalate dehydratase small subunit [Bacillota bacterium]
MSQVIKKKVVAILGDDVDTDVIFPARYLGTFDEQETANHLFEDVDPSFRNKVKNGGVVIVGKNFGCGSAREQAAMALKYAGVTMVVAVSYNRSFYRNAINNGLLLMEFENPEDYQAFKEDNQLIVDYASGIIKNETTGREIRCLAPNKFILDIISAGGICQLIIKNQSKNGGKLCLL